MIMKNYKKINWKRVSERASGLGGGSVRPGWGSVRDFTLHWPPTFLFLLFSANSVGVLFSKTKPSPFIPTPLFAILFEKHPPSSSTLARAEKTLAFCLPLISFDAQPFFLFFRALRERAISDECFRAVARRGFESSKLTKAIFVRRMLGRPGSDAPARKNKWERKRFKWQ